MGLFGGDKCPRCWDRHDASEPCVQVQQQHGDSVPDVCEMCASGLYGSEAHRANHRARCAIQYAMRLADEIRTLKKALIALGATVDKEGGI